MLISGIFPFFLTNMRWILFLNHIYVYHTKEVLTKFCPEEELKTKFREEYS